MIKFIYFNLLSVLVFLLSQNLVAACPESNGAISLGVFKKYPPEGENLIKTTKRSFYISRDKIKFFWCDSYEKKGEVLIANLKTESITIEPRKRPFLPLLAKVDHIIIPYKFSSSTSRSKLVLFSCASCDSGNKIRNIKTKLEAIVTQDLERTKGFYDSFKGKNLKVKY